MTKGAAAQIKCDACDGTGSQPEQKAEPSHRIFCSYPLGG
jgi:hypothetical protein